nr:Serine threonine protein kinase-related domain containing protein [Haemonchus contortus]
MELLGKSLSELRKRSEGKRFDATTALRVGLSMTDTLKVLHDMGYLHRDIKPGNMCVGSSPATIRRIYLLDFGLARQFKEKGKIRRRGHVGFRGTLRYVSLNVHERRDQCTCDDLISNFYTMAELCEGTLPWTRLRDPEDIARRKRNVSFEELFPNTTRTAMTTLKIRTSPGTTSSKTSSRNAFRLVSTSTLPCHGRTRIIVSRP